ncbi:MAG: SRPBCC domain-containing protein [Spirochaetaceae bacterium]
MKYRIETEIIINAPIKSVWSKFVDFKDHTNWNKGFKVYYTNTKVGERFKVDLYQDGKKPMTMNPTLLKNEENKSFEWIGHLLFNGLFDGHHQFHFEDLGDNTTKLLQIEDFSGILIRPLIKPVLVPTELNFKQINLDFKNYLESN